ncbi:pilus assembly protein [Enterovirga sp.]|uniref:TadE/TadG family type IV pilus assembly protein n=1 Tax=Enterovirga sp. TaxID=2026350 RepID=UPI002CBC4FE0|nr:pilus assembly protein [Enterovirga sp.]HMO30430.1 pilus assembly protein [Enterovirga sp.]
MGLCGRFKTDQNGATAILFAFTLIPILGLVGAAIDYSRASMAQSKMQAAIDLAALSIVKLPLNASQATIDQIAKDSLESTFGFAMSTRSASGVTLEGFSASRSGKIISVTANGISESTFMGILGIPSTQIGAQSQAVWTAKKIELALVLDNTGSMGDSIGGGRRKIDALKESANQLLSDLRGAAKEADTVKVSIVPFDTEVRLDPATYRAKPWFDWTRTKTDKTKWTGYVFDRYNSYATSDAAPSAAIADSLFPAPQETTSSMAGSLQTIRPLTTLYDETNYNSLKAVVSGMQPRGYTDIALGAIWGLATLSPTDPFSEAQPASNTEVKKYMVILTDGDNTMNHVNGAKSQSTAQIDTKTLASCSAAKDFGVEVFTIRLVDGNADLLRKCASSSTNYFDVQNAGQLGQAFKSIVDAISGTRISS